MSMRLLLVISFEPKSLKPIEEEIERLKREAKGIYFLFVLDPEVGKSVMDRLLENGFVGEKTAIQLNQAIMRDYRERGYHLLEEVKRMVKERGIPYEGFILEGDIMEECKNIINRFGVDYTIVFVKKKGKKIYKLEEDLKIGFKEVE